MPIIEADRGADSGVPAARLILEAARPTDAAEVVAFSNDRRVLWTLSFLPYPLAAADIVALFDESAESRRWMLVRRIEDRRAIGAAGIHIDADGGAEIGYWLGRDHWGRGYATEIAAALVDRARRMGFDPIRAFTLPDNAASIRVLEKAGFVRDGEARRWYRQRGEDLRVLRYRFDGRRR